MRRLWAFITMLVSVVLGLVFISQPILDNTRVSGEFASGSALVYSVTVPEGRNVLLDDATIMAKINARLDTANLRDGQVDVLRPDPSLNAGEGEINSNSRQVKIAFSQRSDVELSGIRRILEGNGNLAITAHDDGTALIDGEFFMSQPAQLRYDESNKPYVALQPKDEPVWDTMKQKSEASQDEAQKKKLYVWRDFDKDYDTYDKAFLDNPKINEPLVADKVLFTLDTETDYDDKNHEIKITSDRAWNLDNARKPWANSGTEKEWDISSARAMVASLNAPAYGFEFNFVYTVTIAPTLGATTVYWLIGGVAIAFFLIFIFLLVRYGLAGLIALVTNMLGILLTLLISSFLGFEFSLAYLCGLAVIAILGIFITVNYFEHVKVELKKGRPISKANREGYRKSFMTTLDASVTVFAVSLFSFLVAKGDFKVSFAVILIGAFLTFVLVNYFTKWLMYWLTTYAQNGNPRVVFGFTAKVVPLYDSNKPVTAAKDEQPSTGKGAKKRLGRAKKVLIGWGVAGLVLIAGVSVGVGVLASGGSDRIFNLSGSYAPAYRLTLTTTAIGYDDDRNVGDSSVDFNSAEDLVKYIEDYPLKKLADDDNVTVAEYEKATALTFTDSTFSLPEKTNDSGSEGNNKFKVLYATFTMPDLKPGQKAVQDKRNYALSQINESLKACEEARNGNVAANIAAYEATINEDLKALYAYSFYAGTALPGTVGHANTWLFVVLSLIGVFAGIYVAFRYGLAAGLCELVLVTGVGLFGTVLLLATRLPFSAITGFGLLTGTLLIVILSLPFLARNRELLKEEGIYKTADKKARMLGAMTAGKQVETIVLTAGVALTVLGVGLLCAPAGITISLALTFLLTGLMGILFAVTGLPYFYGWLRSTLSFKRLTQGWSDWRTKRQKKRKNKKARVVETHEAQETEIPGLNEYR